MQQSVTLGWQKTPTAIGYRLLLRAEPDTALQVFSLPQQAGQQTLNGLLPGATYTAALLTQCAATEFSDTAWLSFTTLGCNPPGRLRATDIGFREATIRWERQPKAMGYILSYRPADDTTRPPQTVTVTENSFLLTGLQPGAEYLAQVQTLCPDSLRSLKSDSIRFATTVCLPPQNLRLGQVKEPFVGLRWQAAPNAHSYTVYFRAVEEARAQKERLIMLPQYELQLKPGATYEITVTTACDAAGAVVSAPTEPLYYTTFAFPADTQETREEPPVFDPHNPVDKIPVWGSIASYEKDTLDGYFEVTLRLHFTDTLRLDGMLLKPDFPEYFYQQPITGPAAPLYFGWVGQIRSLRGVYYPGDSIEYRFTIRYNKKQLPFYPERLDFSLRQTGRSPKKYKVATMYTYFTPYNTQEIWSEVDFNGLKRIWSFAPPVGALPPPRRYIPRDSVPVSDLSYEQMAADSLPLRLVSQEGLAYVTPMLRTDSLGAPNPPPGAAGKTSGCGCGSQKRFMGTLTGRLLAMVQA